MPIHQNLTIQNHTKVFVESGTFHGDGVYRALQSGYKKVISIEVHEGLWRENINRFASEIESGIVQIIHGDSRYVIGEAIEEINEPITFWFDAHDQTMNEAGVGDLKCPIVHELRSIINHRHIDMRKLDVLLIDDLRLIENVNVGWSVNIGELYLNIWEYNLEFSISREHGHIAHDILKCIPKSFPN